MIRVLVTEDEMPILRSTCTMIERTNPEFKITHRAANGKEALDILKCEEIELLVLDIQMPIMDGVTLLKTMKDEKIKVPTIVLSGFQDFSYVRDALRYGAVDYILKPLKKEELSNVLKRVEQIIWKEKSLRTQSSVIQKELIEQEYNYEIALLISGSYRSDHEDDDIRLEEKYWGEYLERYILENLPKDMCWIIPGKFHNEYLLVCRKLGNRTDRFLEKLKQDVKKEAMLIRPLTIIKSKKQQTHDSIYFENQELHQVAKEVMFLEKGQICTNDVQEVKRQNKVQHDELCKVITDINHPEQILPCIRKALHNVERRSVMIALLKTGFWRYSELFKGNYTYMELEEELVRILENTYSKEVLYEELEKLVVHDFYNEQFNNSNKSKLALQMRGFIENNYMRGINNHTLSEHFGYVPAHLRELFRKQYDISPMEYLQVVRLEKSKQLLETQLELSLKEIADAVGFNDSLYFSKVFRKHEGVSPSEYRKQIRDVEKSGA